MPSGENWQRILIKEIRANGFKVARTGNGAHQKVLTKQGAVVTDTNGALLISGSPSDHRAREMHVQRFMAAGVLKKDPFKATREGDTDDRQPKHLKDPAVEARRLAALRERSDALKQQSMVIRSRVEPVVAKLGGWGNRTSLGAVSPLEFAEVCWNWAIRADRRELPETTTRGEPVTLDHMRQAVMRLKNPSETLPERWLPIMKAFADELERQAGDPPDAMEAANHYRTLLRESRQLPLPDEDFEEDETFTPEQKNLHDHLAEVTAKWNGNGSIGPEAPEYERFGPMYEAEGLPVTAMEVLYRIDPAGTDFDTAMRLAMEVARMERSARPPKQVGRSEA